MARILMIVESPNKRAKIKGYLEELYPNDTFVVEASYGHIRDLGKGGFENIGYTVPEFKGIYEVSEKSLRIAKILKNESKAADKVILATDLDREGEGIAYHLKVLLALPDSKYQRVTFAEITKQGIQAGMSKPRMLNMNLVYAQETRRLLDRLIGFGLHKAVMDAVRFHSSCGRVQSVATKLIVERENAIKNFVSTDYYNVSLNFQEGWSAKWISKLWMEPGQEYWTDKQSATQLANHFDDKSKMIRVSKIDRTEVISNPQKPFITSTLQKAAFVNLKLDPDETMKIAQVLFENGHITYMRTDSPNLSDEAIEDIKQWGIKNDTVVVGRKWASKASAQEAHEAVRPTDFFSRIVSNDPNEQALYELIWNRAIVSQLETAIYAVREITLETAEEVNITLNGNSEKRIATYQAKCRKVKFEGYLAFTKQLKVSIDDDEIEDDTEENDLNNPIPETLSEGDLIPVLESVLKPTKTKPPARYTKASIIAELERRGIGRPSTYATILGKLFDRKYIKESKRKLHALDRGIKLVETINNQFSFMDYSYTARMEKQLDYIAKGKADWYETMKEIHHQTIDVEREKFKKEVYTNIPYHKCPECNQGRMMPRITESKVEGSKGTIDRAFWICDFSGCRHTMSDKDGAPVVGWKKEMTGHTCISCNTNKLIKLSKTMDDGKFIVKYKCSAYAEKGNKQCIADYKDTNGTPNFDLWKENHTYKCVEENCTGFLVKRSGKDAKDVPWTAYICENYKKTCYGFYKLKEDGTPNTELFLAEKEANKPKRTKLPGYESPCSKGRCKGTLHLYEGEKKGTGTKYHVWICEKCNTFFFNTEENKPGNPWSRN